MKHYLLLYDVSEDYPTRRGEFRNAHLELAWAAAERGELLLAGALTEPMDASMLLFQGESPAAAEAFVAADPYVANGLVKSWRIREWSTVVGAGASNPLRPQQRAEAKQDPKRPAPTSERL